LAAEGSKEKKIKRSIMEPWKVIYRTYDPEEERKQEALCTLGNGYFATRGAAEESRVDKYHYPGTYLAGGYNRLKSDIQGRVIENEDFVNWPNWLVLTFQPDEGPWLDLDKMKILDYEKRLNLSEGVLERDFTIEDGHKRITQLQTRRIVHLSQKNLGVIQWKLTPKNWSGALILKSALDGTVINNGVPRYSQLNGQHLRPVATGTLGTHGIFLKVQTVQSEITMAQAAQTTVQVNDQQMGVERQVNPREDYIEENITFEVQQNRTYTIEKVVALFTSRDNGISEPLLEAKKKVQRAPRYEELLERQKAAWQSYWRRCDIDITSSDDQDQLLLRLHIFHLLQTTSINTIDLDVGVPARGLHGEAYRGHIFWDELFIFPFLTFSAPEITRALLMYRYRRMEEARYAAKEAGYKGTMFPWQSGSNGREESQVIHLNPESGRWIPDNTHLQRHVNAAIAYNIWQYFQISDDYEFLSFYGTEMLLQIARFWASMVTFNEKRQRFEIHQVVGPDEYHTKYPGAQDPGLRNNSYTNVMAVWTLRTAREALDHLDEPRRKEILKQCELSEDDMTQWSAISQRMYIPFMDGGIISQFEGWEALDELDWETYHDKYGEVLRLDRVLEDEGDSTNRYKATKQADVLMLFYLFSSEELIELFELMNYDFDPQWIPKNIHYYNSRTSHGSTLSKMVHSWVLARLNREQSWHSFAKALVSDFLDIQGGTTAEGIHLGAMAGTVDLIQRCYTGLEYRRSTLWFNPTLPEHLDCIDFQIRYHGRWIKVQLTEEELKLTCGGGREIPINLKVKNQEVKFEMGETQVFKLGEETVETS
jgi:trehalose/maltose hydrolase-like predicted phosphorylase